VDMHRVVKEILDQLIFKCPTCGQKRSFVDMMKHIADCGGQTDSSNQPVLAKKESVVTTTNQQKESLSIQNMKGLDIYIMEKDSRKFYIYNTLD
jgi:hypothetical protein